MLDYICLLYDCCAVVMDVMVNSLFCNLHHDGTA
jgi:hypothetical protein